MTRPESNENDVAWEVRLEHAIADYLRRLDRGEAVDQDAFAAEYPDCAGGLRDYFAAVEQVERMAGPRIGGDGEAPPADGPVANPGWDSWERRTFPFTFSRYRVLRRLGRGGMGSVYLATDTELDRPVALKIPRHDDRGEGRKVLERFVRETRVHVQHPNVCTVYDAGVVNGQPFLCMAYVDGQPLAALITPDDLLPPGEAAALIKAVALAMAAAHAAGVVHRDLKPGNIMVDRRGQPIVMDFGLAHRETGDEARLTSEGKILGSPAYLSPEQIRPDVGGVDHATDIYSLGVTFYELLTGRRPFQGSVLQLLSQIREETPAPPSRYRPDLDRTLEAICLRMMAKRPSDRFPSMEEVADALDRWLGLAAERSETASELRDLRRRLNLLGVAGGLAAGGLGLLGLANLLGGGVPDGDAAGPGCDPATGPQRAGPHAEAWHSPFEALLAEPAQVEKADPHFGTPGHDRAFWEGQQNYADTCAIRCQEFILHQFTGVDTPESVLVDEAMQRGWYTPGQGTDLHDVGKLLELHGVAVNRYTDANVFHLAHELAQGHKVIIGVDSGQLWGHNPTMDAMLDTMQDRLGLPPHADHAVVVSGIDTTDPHHVRVILSDPGDGQPVASYPLDQFLHAWEGSHFFMVATREPAPAHLPEMVHFDYAAGHLASVADVPYDQFVEKFAHHPEAWEHWLEHLADAHESVPGLAADHDHDPGRSTHNVAFGHGDPHPDHHHGDHGHRDSDDAHQGFHHHDPSHPDELAAADDSEAL